MPQFFVPSSYIIGNEITIQGNEFHHIVHVLRKKTGEFITLFDEYGNQYAAEIKEITREKIICLLIEKRQAEQKPPCTLYQCIPKARKMDIIVEKCTELGVTQITPILSQNVIVKLDEKSTHHKMERWHAIVQASAKQSGNTHPPLITEPMSFENAIDKIDEHGNNLIAFEHGTQHLKTILPSLDRNKPLQIIIGAEGGFTHDEIIHAETKGWTAFRLYGNILRAETASTVILSILNYELGYM